jgi:hypothetical protein
MRGWRLVLLVAVTGAFLWLMRTSAPPRPLHPVNPQDAQPGDLGAEFDPARCGSLACRVEWTGPAPTVQPISLFQARVRPNGQVNVPNPNAPRVSADNGLADAVIWLHRVDPKRSGPWNLPPVRVEHTQQDLTVYTGERRGRLGIVRRGEPVEIVSLDAAMHSVRGRGADFFTLMLFRPIEPVSRPLGHTGIVELTSGTWYYWMRGYLVVSDHPYAGVTDEQGNVAFEQVPDGEYEVSCWKANWHIAKLERDPEWVLHTGLTFQPPVERQQRVQVVAGQTASLLFRLSDADFAPRDSGPPGNE